jgi:hypothetical protein
MKTMRTFSIFFLLLSLPTLGLAQGSLNPTNGPAPGMKTLQDLWGKLLEIEQGPVTNVVVVTNTVEVFTERPWISVGAVSNFQNIVTQYPASNYTWGISINSLSGYVHEVSADTWNRGWRLMTRDPYLQGDDATTMLLGVSLLTSGTDDVANDFSHWTHSYYQATNGTFQYSGSLGTQDDTPFYVREHSPWIPVGVVSNMPSIMAQYPTRNYVWGIEWNSLNGYIREVNATTWNVGWRLLTRHPYLQGDHAASMGMGRTVLTTGTNDVGNDFSNWNLHYYRLIGGAWVRFSSAGVRNTVPVHVQQR